MMKSGGTGNVEGPGPRSDAPVRVVFPAEEAQRLDSFLSRVHPDFSRNQFRKLILEGRVLVNGQPAKPSRELRAGEEVSVRFPVREELDELVPEPMHLDILFEDEDLVVLNKAPGVVVHPGAGHSEGTLVHGLLAHCPRLALQGAPRRPGIVHRLDRDTSGAMVIAKSERAYLDLVGQFKEHSVRKEYRVLVYGKMQEADGRIETLLGRHPMERKKMAVVSKGGKPAVSRWRVETRWEEVSLLTVAIHTGRTHQIRVHLSHIQHPVVGDSTYGGGKRRARLVRDEGLRELLAQVDRQMLHALRLGFRHPASRTPLEFVAPLPGDFSRLLESMGAPAEFRAQKSRS
ncbi:MAG TPA: RluA family pseudouridine synthase [Syntrophobacteraceae bacterium]|nr:RluA family pseudouridine synthase [Syntrophobacteraceae bacterium]